VTSLEALAIDYVKAFDVLIEWSKKMDDYKLANGPIACQGQEFQDMEFQYNQAWGSIYSSLAAIRSHVHAAYAEELRSI
jgi:hypothetical protein